MQPPAVVTEMFAVFVGIDWADTKHDLCLQAAGGTERESRTLTHTPEAIEEWVQGLRQRFNGQPIAILAPWRWSARTEGV